MSRKKQKFTDCAASLGASDYFGTVFDGMCQSKAYQSLNLSARHFYTLCRVQARSPHGRACLYRHGEEFGVTYTDRDFVFPSKHLQLYGVDRGNAHKCFRKLIEAGFIEKREGNKHMKKVNVYRFSEKWKEI